AGNSARSHRFRRDRFQCEDGLLQWQARRPHGPRVGVARRADGPIRPRGVQVRPGRAADRFPGRGGQQYAGGPRLPSAPQAWAGDCADRAGPWIPHFVMTPKTGVLPSLRRELVRALSLVSVAWLAAVFVVVAIGVRHQVDEIMDGALQEAAEILYGLLAPARSDLALMAGGSMLAPPHDEGLVWQIVDENQQVVL